MRKAREEFEIELPPYVQSTLELVGSTALLKVAQRVPESSWFLSLAEIEQRVKPSRVAYELRRAFWMEFEVALGGRKRSVQLTDLARTARCSYMHAYQMFNEKPELLAWILRPARDLELEFRVTMGHLLAKIERILQLPITDEKGRLITKNANMLWEMFKYFEPRYGHRIGRV